MAVAIALSAASSLRHEKEATMLRVRRLATIWSAFWLVSCSLPGATEVNCRHSPVLLSTADGGGTWQIIHPEGADPAVEPALSLLPLLNFTMGSARVIYATWDNDRYGGGPVPTLSGGILATDD